MPGGRGCQTLRMYSSAGSLFGERAFCSFRERRVWWEGKLKQLRESFPLIAHRVPGRLTDRACPAGTARDDSLAPWSVREHSCPAQ